MGIGTGMVLLGEVAIILATLHLDRGILPAKFCSTMIFIIALTTVVTPLLKIGL